MSSWFARPINLCITVVASALAVIVTVLLVWGIATHEEPGLLDVCWADGQAIYLDPTQLEAEYPTPRACSGPEKLTWSDEQIPLTVAAETADGQELGSGAETRKALDAAVRNLNAQLGFELFRSVGGPSAAIVVEIGKAVDAQRDAPGGYASHSKGRDGLLRCDIGIYSNLGSERGEFLAHRHELLHAAGLAHHPNNPNSIMYPLTRDDSLSTRMSTVRVTDGSKALLRELYLYAPHDRAAREEFERLEKQRREDSQ